MTELVLPVGARDHVRGNPDAPVTIVEYADVECPYCRRLEPVLRELLDRRSGVVRLVFRHFPLIAVHPHAYSAALALEAAGREDRFWDLHDLLLADGAPLGRAALARHAESLDLDPELLLRPGSEAFDGKVREDFASGVDSGVAGTPGLFIDGVRLLRPPALPQLLQFVDVPGKP